MNLLELRKYAIDHRVEIRFGAPQSLQECLISEKGQVKIPGEDKGFRVEDVFNAAEMFVIAGNGTARQLSREAMAEAVNQEMQRKGADSHAEEDE